MNKWDNKNVIYKRIYSYFKILYYESHIDNSVQNIVQQQNHYQLKINVIKFNRILITIQICKYEIRTVTKYKHWLAGQKQQEKRQQPTLVCDKTYKCLAQKVNNSNKGTRKHHYLLYNEVKVISRRHSEMLTSCGIHVHNVSIMSLGRYD